MRIDGRDELPIDVKARLDGEYVRRMSLGFDARCILAAAFKVLRSEGVAEGIQTDSERSEEHGRGKRQSQTQRGRQDAGSE